MINRPETLEFDIIIAGGGAAGLAAAVCCGRAAAGRLRIGVIEKKEVPGKKLSATGNGRCNLSNAACTDREEVDSFFNCLGLLIRTDEAGRMYPYSEEAGEVTSLLTEAAQNANVKILTGCQVLRAAEEDGGFSVAVNGLSETGTSFLHCKKLLLAMGGKSYSVFGTTGDGYGIARRLGHSVTRLAPSLVPVSVDADLAGLAGVRAKAKVTLRRLGEIVAEEEGEVQFNKDCISGICIMNLSRLLVLNQDKPFAEAFGEYELAMDFVPELQANQLTAFLQKKPKKQMLQTLVRKKLAAYITQRAETAEETARMLKNLRFQVTGTKGWSDAQVTRGGVELAEVNQETMESKRVPGLYFAGEVLDYDGPCGGWNLHFAWKSGIRAGRAMAEDLLAEPADGK